jgi:hypothetical protein
MKKLFLLLASSMMLVSCASAPGVTLTSCTDETNRPSDGATIKYKYKADDILEMSMKLKSHTRNKSQFRVNLKPNGNQFWDVVVTTKGVSGTLPDGGSTPFDWLDGSGSYKSTKDDQRAIILCVPGVPVGTWYKFDITVAGVGTIDPRVEVN